jgi:hypothetical protein
MRDAIFSVLLLVLLCGCEVSGPREPYEDVLKSSSGTLSSAEKKDAIKELEAEKLRQKAAQDES